MTSLTYTGVEPLVLGTTGIQTNSFLPTTATAYKRGDLVAVSAAGVLTHSADGADFNAIILESVTAAQATKHAADGIGIPVYTQLDANLDAVMINGVKLNTSQKLAAKAHSVTSTSLTLRAPANTKGA